MFFILIVIVLELFILKINNYAYFKEITTNYASLYDLNEFFML